MKQQIIAQGAEAILIKDGETLTKDRIKKGYRIDFLDDKLRKSRTKKERKILDKVSKLIPVPEIKKGKDREDKFKIQMEFLRGKKLSEHLDNLKNAVSVCEKIGENVAKLHDEGIIHGDLTTSNIIFKEGEVYFIDFGLGFHSNRREDKAVDLHLLRQALEAKHFSHWEKFFNAVLRGYSPEEKKLILEQLKKVEARGRYKKGF